jgi:hypothetical protein
MDEERWLACEDPHKLLEFLRTSDRANNRKLRLFAAACCRRFVHLLKSKTFQRAVEVADRFTDGLASSEEVGRAFQNANYGWGQRTAVRIAGEAHVRGDRPLSELVMDAWHAVTDLVLARRVCHRSESDAFNYHIDRLAELASSVAIRAAATQDGERAMQCAWLRDLFGPLPFRPVTIAHAVLTWDGGLVVRLAQAAYDERHLPAGTLDNDRLAVLADALEEADCQDGQILGHLRGAGPHVRGCWVVDCLLGKE